MARSPFRSQNVKSTTCLDHFWTFKCRFVWPAQGIVHLVKKREGFAAVSTTTTLRYVALHYTNYITLHYTTLHSTTLNSNPRHYINDNYNYKYTTLHYTTLHPATPATPEMQLQLHYYTNYMTLHYTPLYTPRHYATPH